MLNVFLWILQAMLAFLFVASGAYKLFSFEELSQTFAALPLVAWQALGILEIVGAVLLIVPAALHRKPTLTWIAATVLTVETFGLAALYATYSLELAATNPLPWAVVIGVLSAFVAYIRRNLAPLDR